MTRKKVLLIAAAIFSLIATYQIALSALLINGAGATFPYPIYSKWFDTYAKDNPGIHFNYQSIGSGGGIRMFSNKTVDFGASDAPMTDEQIQKVGGKVYHFPSVLGADVVAYNVPGVTGKLKLTGPLIADIFMGKITKWSDPEIAKLNPGVDFPPNDIAVCHRSDGSGTSYIFTDYLSKASPEWASKVGKSTAVKWPTGFGGKGNEGVTALVQQTPGAIGYVELIYALSNHIPYALVRNHDGKWIDANLQSVTAAAAGVANNMPSDFRVSITDAPGADAYPISSFTYLLVYPAYGDKTKGEQIVKFLKWALHDGQQLAPSLNYAPLPPEVVKLEDDQIGKIQMQ